VEEEMEVIKGDILHDIYFGGVGEPGVNWRNLPDETDPDDEELEETPADVVLLLGFDPKEFSREEKQVGITNVLKYGTASSGNYGHAGRPGERGGSGEGGSDNIKVGVKLDRAREWCMAHARSSTKSEKEVGYTIKTDGSFHRAGEGNGQVEINDAQNIMHLIHSHPNESSFSDADIKALILCKNMKTIEAITPKGTIYRLEKNKASEESAEARKETADYVGIQWNLFFKMGLGDFSARYKKGEDVEKLIKEHSSAVAKRVASNWGLKYTESKIEKKKSVDNEDVQEDKVAGERIIIDDSIILKIENLYKEF
jgi:hypothetical protein